MNDTMTTLVVGAASLVSFICFIVVLIQMFQHGDGDGRDLHRPWPVLWSGRADCVHLWLGEG